MSDLLEPRSIGRRAAAGQVRARVGAGDWVHARHMPSRFGYEIGSVCDPTNTWFAMRGAHDALHLLDHVRDP